MSSARSPQGAGRPALPEPSRRAIALVMAKSPRTQLDPGAEGALEASAARERAPSPRPAWGDEAQVAGRADQAHRHHAHHGHAHHGHDHAHDVGPVALASPTNDATGAPEPTLTSLEPSLSLGQARPSDDALRDLMRARGLRATAPRLAVLQSLFGTLAPITHAELVALLGPSGWDRATIYRNLVDLTEIGLVRRTDVGDHVWRFELVREGARDEGHHAHFVCDTCGDVTCLPSETVSLQTSSEAPSALRARNVEIQIRGRCDNCV